jgi:hypothetical protein
MQPTHPWKARLTVGIIMLVLAFLGMVITDVQKVGGWDYWKWMVPVYAILALWLSWYVKRKQQTISPITIWHELLHWAGLICAIFLVSHLVQLGTISRFIAGIFHLILLSLAVFLAGIYIETIFILIGIVLGVFALLTAMLVQYMYAFVIPVAIAAVLVTAIAVWISHKKFKQNG